MQLLSKLINNDGLKVLLIVIVLDVIFGVLRAIKEKSINSTIGIDGVIRKVGMLISIIFFFMIDLIVKINLLGFIPEGIRDYCNISEVGISTLFNMIFIVFEILSVLKNMIKCKLPISKKLQRKLEELMKEFTCELEENGLNTHINEFKK